MTEPILKERLLPKFSIHRPVTVIMILCSILLIGTIAYFKIKIDLFPSGMNNPYLGVWVSYPDANPKEIAEQIVKPIEGYLKTVKNLKRVYSSISTRGNWFWLEFSQNTNMDVAYAQVSDRLERSRADIPEEIEHFWIRRFRENDEPIVYSGISFDSTVVDPSYLIEKFLKQPLEGTKGVANVEFWGINQKYYQVIVNEDKIKAYHINLSQVVQKLRQDNFALSCGRVYYGKHKLLLRSSMKFSNLEQIQNINLGNGILLKNIAEVKFDFDDEIHSIMRVNGNRAAGLAVYKESSANTVEVSKVVTQIIEKQFAQRKELKNSHHHNFFNQGKVIVNSIDGVKITGLWGICFAFLVLFYFLRHFKTTLMLSLAIPLALLVTIIVLFFAGWTLNLITLMGIMISVGMVVDNAIVITENIYRFHNMGYSLKDAAIKGASEVGLAITLATLTTIVVFLPLMFMSGDSNMSFFLTRIGMPVVIALLSSLLIALVFIPLISTKITGEKKISNPNFIKFLGKKYTSILNWILNHRIDATIVIMILILSQMIPLKNMKQQQGMEGGIRDANLRISFPSYYGYERCDSILCLLTDKIMDRDSLYHIKDITSRVWGHHGRIAIYMEPFKNTQWYHVIYEKVKDILKLNKDQRIKREDLAEDIKKNLPEIPGVKIRTSWRDQGSMGFENKLEFNLRGNDIDKLVDIAEDLEKQMMLIEGVLGATNDFESGNNEIHVSLDREKSYQAGLSPWYVAQYMAFSYRGRKISNFQTPNREIPIYLKAESEKDESIQFLKNTSLKNNQGKETNLSSIAKFQFTKGIGQIRRENGKSFIKLEVFLQKENKDIATQQIFNLISKFNFPKGYSVERGGNFRDFDNEKSTQNLALILAVSLVFILMGVLFESFILPLSILIAIPAAFTGSYWLLWITHTSFDMMAMIGFVILIGVVVNNGIVLIDMINQFRLSGLSRSESIMEAANHRFRPILMTAITTICGLLPMALGRASLIGISYSPLGVTMIGGLISSTILTLFAVPVFYTFLDDLRGFWNRFIKSFLG